MKFFPGDLYRYKNYRMGIIIAVDNGYYYVIEFNHYRFDVYVGWMIGDSFYEFVD